MLPKLAFSFSFGGSSFWGTTSPGRPGPEWPLKLTCWSGRGERFRYPLARGSRFGDRSRSISRSRPLYRPLSCILSSLPLPSLSFDLRCSRPRPPFLSRLLSRVRRPTLSLDFLLSRSLLGLSLSLSWSLSRSRTPSLSRSFGSQSRSRPRRSVSLPRSFRLSRLHSSTRPSLPRRRSRSGDWEVSHRLDIIGRRVALRTGKVWAMEMAPETKEADE